MTTCDMKEVKEYVTLMIPWLLAAAITLVPALQQTAETKSDEESVSSLLSFSCHERRKWLLVGVKKLRNRVRMRK